MDLSVLAFLVLLALVGLTRVAELIVSHRHQQELVRLGAAKRNDPQYRWMVILHVSVLFGAALEVLFLHRPFIPLLSAIALTVVFLSTALRWWVIRTLGIHWNVEVMSSAGLGIVSSGPFRWVRHPNYLAVFAELIALPLVHCAWITSLVAAIGNAIVIQHRLRIEEPVLWANLAYREQMGGKPRFLPRVLRS